MNLFSVTEAAFGFFVEGKKTGWSSFPAESSMKISRVYWYWSAVTVDLRKPRGPTPDDSITPKLSCPLLGVLNKMQNLF